MTQMSNDSYGDGNVYRGQRSKDSVVKTITLAQPEEPCDMKEMCIGCSPRNADGSCPDAQRKPLTDDELIAIYETEQQGRWGDHVRGLRAVEEAAHGIKE